MSDWPPAEPPPVPSGPPAPGWWLASDGRYYPPEQSPGYLPPPVAGYSPYGAPTVQTTGTNGLAVASMVLGILWLWWIGSILALVFGYVAKSQIEGSGRRQTGRGMAIAGIVLGWVGVTILVLLIGLVALGRDKIDTINSDPSDGFCNESRYLEDPDC